MDYKKNNVNTDREKGYRVPETTVNKISKSLRTIKRNRLNRPCVIKQSVTVGKMDYNSNNMSPTAYGQGKWEGKQKVTVGPDK
jgi:hypothetical protein